MDFSTKKFLRNPATLLIALLLFVWLGVQFWGVAKKAYVLREERKRLETELVLLQKRKAELEEGLARLQSEAFLEREAKRRLNLKNPGEQVVVIVPEEKKEATTTPQSFWSRVGSILFFWR
ncbi:MAG: septum formation initiator family protein [bacterium]|nr:septum formation initiator family protein [bacterium]